MSLKQARMNERLREIISTLLLREVEDPRLQGVTVTDVTLDAELQYARVYVNALGDEERREDVMQGLKRANGFLRREVGKRVRLRKTPELHFQWDTTLEYGENMNQLLDSLDIPEEQQESETPEEDHDAPRTTI